VAASAAALLVPPRADSEGGDECGNRLCDDQCGRRESRCQVAPREYWGIENKLHRVRDVTCGEDDSQVRSGAAPQVCAALRNLMIALLRRTGVENIAAALRTHSGRPRAALALVLAPLTE
jgi:hypothetical protein